MKYKVGDTVKIKSLDWYNKNKDTQGEIWFDNNVFTEEMTTIPIKGDVIQRNGSNWEVLLRRFMFDTEEGNYVKIYIKPYNLYL